MLLGVVHGAILSKVESQRDSLGFLNTKLAMELLRQINPTANNSANYLKRLPVVAPKMGELGECDQLVRKAIEEGTAFRETRKATLDELESLYRSKGLRKPNPEVVQALLAAIEDSDEQVRQEAIAALRHLDPDAAAKAGVK